MTIRFNNVYLGDSYSFLGKNQFKVDLKVDEIVDDYYMNKKSVEQAEIEYQKKTIEGVIKKSNKNVDLIISSDLQNQLLASNYCASTFDYPFLSTYSACSSYVSNMICAASLLSFKNIKNAILTVSSHNLSSEKNYRYPIEYGSVRKKVNTFTLTGSVSTIISSKKSNIKVESATIGRVVDYGYKDANNMGGSMAPSVAKTISDHLKDTKRKAQYYDLILTGDLGIYGVEILKNILEKEYKVKANNIVDAGSILYIDPRREYAGASGPTCLPMVLINKILKETNFKRILIVGSGSLHSKNSVNQNLSIPSVSHIISLEVE